VETQAREIQEALEKEGWKLTDKERPISETYWWVWEFWHFQRNNQKIILSFLIDPQASELKNKNNVWAVKASIAGPEGYGDPSQIAQIDIGRNWKRELPKFVVDICSSEK